MLDTCYDFCTKWKIRLNPAKTFILRYHKQKTHILEVFYLGNQKVIPTSSCSHLGISWHNKDKNLLTQHVNQKMRKLKQHMGQLIANGIKLSHPNTIAHILKHQLLPKLYWIEFADYNSTILNNLNRDLRIATKTLFSMNPKCSNVLFDVFEIPSFLDLVKFRCTININQLSIQIIRNKCCNLH